MCVLDWLKSDVVDLPYTSLHCDSCPWLRQCWGSMNVACRHQTMIAVTVVLDCDSVEAAWMLITVIRHQTTIIVRSVVFPVCPIGWKPGADTIKPTVKGSKIYFSGQSTNWLWTSLNRRPNIDVFVVHLKILYIYVYDRLECETCVLGLFMSCKLVVHVNSV